VVQREVAADAQAAVFRALTDYYRQAAPQEVKTVLLLRLLRLAYCRGATHDKEPLLSQHLDIAGLLAVTFAPAAKFPFTHKAIGEELVSLAKGETLAEEFEAEVAFQKRAQERHAQERDDSDSDAAQERDDSDSDAADDTE
jgi:hypothetical protein